MEYYVWGFLVLSSPFPFLNMIFQDVRCFFNVFDSFLRSFDDFSWFSKHQLRVVFVGSLQGFYGLFLGFCCGFFVVYFWMKFLCGLFLGFRVA